MVDSVDTKGQGNAFLCNQSVTDRVHLSCSLFCLSVVNQHFVKIGMVHYMSKFGIGLKSPFLFEL